MVVCEYWPRGNVAGDKNQYFKENVKSQVKGKNTDTVVSGVTSTSTATKTATAGVPNLGSRIGKHRHFLTKTDFPKPIFCIRDAASLPFTSLSRYFLFFFAFWHGSD